MECETCGALLSAADGPGLCGACRREIRRIAPPLCAACGRPVRTRGGKCAPCLTERFHFDRAFACAVYDGKMKELLHAYKFHKKRALKKFLAAMLLECLASRLRDHSFHFVLPVPMDPGKWATRGFNPSALLSEEISRKTGIPHDGASLGRFRSDSPQFKLDKNGRAQNVKGLFWVNHQTFAGKRLLLVDDILTTGQTASECARVLKESGAADVTVLTCARGV